MNHNIFQLGLAESFVFHAWAWSVLCMYLWIILDHLVVILNRQNAINLPGFAERNADNQIRNQERYICENKFLSRFQCYQIFFVVSDAPDK
jgi:hypothetical protein